MAEISLLANILAGGTAGMFHDTQAGRRFLAWKKAMPIPGRDPAIERWDCDWFVIRWTEYGQLTEYGWEIDHIVASILGGPDTHHNLRARHWRGNRSAGASLGNALAG